MWNPFKKQDLKKLMDKRPIDLEGPTVIPEPPPVACHVCGGLFVFTSLQSVPTAVLHTSRTGGVIGLNVQQEGYCRGCKPMADILLTMETEGKTQDTRRFRITDGYFQEVDAASGDDIYPASMEEYSHIFCADCGEESDWKKHRTCPYRAEKAPPRKTAKKKTTTT